MGSSFMPNLVSGALLAGTLTVNSFGAFLPAAPPTASSVADIEAMIKELMIHLQGLHASVTAFASQGPGTVYETLVRLLAFPVPYSAGD